MRKEKNNVTITINGEKISVRRDSLVIDAASSLNISIPTLCHIKNEKPFTSCMICMVKDNSSNQLIPACSTRVEENMDIITDSPEVHHFRKAALELLLSEHLGDCEAQCRMICPAFLNIPAVIRDIQLGNIDTALEKIIESIPIPKIISLICKAPCEKGCRRKRHDAPLSIRSLMHYTAFTANRKKVAKFAESEKSAAIIGSGPAGLSTAWYLLQRGYKCVVFEKNNLLGGGLRSIPKTTLPPEIIDEEIALIESAGCEFRRNREIKYLDINVLKNLKTEFDAVVIAPGSANGTIPDNFDMPDWLFTVGDILVPTKQAVRSVADGRETAEEIDLFWKKNIPAEPQKHPHSSSYFDMYNKTHLKNRIDSRLGPLKDGDMEQFLKTASPDGKLEPDDKSGIFTPKNAEKESARCLHCDCKKAESCRLRDLATEYGASQKHYNTHLERTGKFIRNIDQNIIYEPGKCIKCGICVRICAKFAEKEGMTFTQHSHKTEVALPFNIPLSRGLGKAADECIKNCPTGALALIINC